MFYPGDNPIKSVDGKKMPPPSVYQVEMEDISGDGAKRTEDTVMQKNGSDRQLL